MADSITGGRAGSPVQSRLGPSTVPADAKVVPPRHWGRLVGAAAVLAVVVWIVLTLADAAIDWAKVPEYFVDSRVLEGVVGTLELTAAAMAVGITVGVLLAVMREGSNPVVKFVAGVYIWLFRAVPTLVQLLLWFNLALLLPTISIPLLPDVETNTVMTPFLAALLGLGLAEGAYMAEIVRGGIAGVDRGQVEAAKSLGMSTGRTMRRIVLPQAARLVIPPTGNQTISMLKYTSLAFVIAYSELLSQAKKIYSVNFEVLEVLFAATAWYLVLVSIFSVGQRWLERRLARTSGRGDVARRKLSLRGTARG